MYWPTGTARLIDYQRTIPFAAALGGGMVASVDGLRFTVPVSSIRTAPSPKHFGYKRGVTWLNAVNDQVMGIGAVGGPVHRETRRGSWT